MKIKEYLENTGISATAFARMLEIPKQTVYSWVRGVRPHTLMLKKIQRMTNGAITPADYPKKK